MRFYYFDNFGGMDNGASCKIIESSGFLKDFTTSMVNRTDEVREKAGSRLFLGQICRNYGYRRFQSAELSCQHTHTSR